MQLVPSRLVPAVVAVLVLAFAAAARGQDRDRWYTLEMFGGKAGWMHARMKTEGGRITTGSRTVFSLKRDDAGVSMEMETEFVETTEGKPVSMKSVQKLGAMAVTQEFTFTETGVELLSRQGGKETRSTLAKPEGTWLTPAAAERYVLQRYKSGAKEIVVRTIDPSNGIKVVTATRTGFEPATARVKGAAVEAVLSVVEMSIMPGVKSKEWTDAEGELLRSETLLGGQSIVMSLSTEREAKAKGKGPAPEVMNSTLIHPDKPIPGARRTTKIVYLLSVPEAPLPELVSAGAQKVESLGPVSARVTVDVKNPLAAAPEDGANPALLKATAMCNSDDDLVRAIAARGVEKAGTDAAARAEALRRAVYSHIRKKTMDVGFASASEVARNAEGDCSEHGVLLAAVLRANGIPSRVCAGLIYADAFAGAKNVFGYHMWAQALITEGGVARWVDLDATLPPSTPFDATHITLGVSDLSDGEATAGLASVASSMGRLKIAVESVE